MPHSIRSGAARHIAEICVAGLVVSIVMFAMTSGYASPGYLGPLCRSSTIEAGFDPWTGLPHGPAYVCEPTFAGDPPTHLVAEPIPAELVGRRAIPMPVGFAVGAVAAGLFLALRDRRRRRPVTPLWM